MQVLLGAATLFFCFRTWISRLGFQDLGSKTQTETMVPLVVLLTWDCYSSPIAMTFFFSYSYYYFSLRTLAPKTWLSGPGFQDSDRQAHATHLTIVSSFSRHFSLRPPSLFFASTVTFLFLVTFLCVHRHFSFSRHFSLRPVVTDI
jgi:hypothetical protein